MLLSSVLGMKSVLKNDFDSMYTDRLFLKILEDNKKFIWNNLLYAFFVGKQTSFSERISRGGGGGGGGGGGMEYFLNNTHR